MTAIPPRAAQRSRAPVAQDGSSAQTGLRAESSPTQRLARPCLWCERDGLLQSIWSEQPEAQNTAYSAVAVAKL